MLLGEVTDIDLEAQTVTSHVLGRETVTPYDSLIVAAGSSQSYFGNDGFAEFAPGMKSIDDALELRGRIFGAFELAELGAMRGENVDALLTFVVVGAGPTGVEMAGQIAELSRRTLSRDFRAINSRHARVVLVDAAGQVLPPFGAKLGVKTKRAAREARCRGAARARWSPTSTRAASRSQLKDGSVERIESLTKIWAAGVQASALTATLSEQTGAPLDRAGRIAVNSDLTLPGHPEVFVVGDMIDLDHLPGVAQVAIQGAKYAAKAIDRRLEGKPPQKPFKYFDKGSLATISRFRAVALIGRFRLTGLLAWLLWLAVHLLYLTGFKNRVTAVLHWAVSFLGRGRQERTATEQQIFGRMALNRLDHGAADLVSPPAPEQTAEGPGGAPRGARGDRGRGGPAHRRRRARRQGRGGGRLSPARPVVEELALASVSKPLRPALGPARAPSARHSKNRGEGVLESPFAIASRAHFGRMNSPSASTVTPSGPQISPRAQVLMPSDRSIQASAVRSPSAVRCR